MFYTIAEVSKELNISPYTIKEWIQKGKLKAVKIGRLWRITEETLYDLKEGKVNFDGKTEGKKENSI